ERLDRLTRTAEDLQHVIQIEALPPDERGELRDHFGARPLTRFMPAHPVGDDEDRRGREHRILTEGAAESCVRHRPGGDDQRGAHVYPPTVTMRSPISIASPSRTCVRSPGTHSMRCPSRTTTVPFVECRSMIQPPEAGSDAASKCVFDSD